MGVYYRSMSILTTQTYKRVNITLPAQTLKRLRHVSPERSRSRFIAEAIDFYLKEKQRSEVRVLLQDGALQRAKRDRTLAENWFTLDL